jgi:hypothetical protein
MASRVVGQPARQELLPLCRALLGAISPANVSATPPHEPVLPQCPRCGGAMQVIERLTAKQILREEQRQVYAVDSS